MQDFTGKYLFDHLAVAKFLKVPPSGDIKGSKPDIFHLSDQSLFTHKKYICCTMCNLTKKSKVVVYLPSAGAQTIKNAKNEVYWKQPSKPSKPPTESLG